MNWTAETSARLARALIHEAEDAALGTLSASGSPHVSHVATATLVSGAPLVLISNLAVHTKNIRIDARASLLFVAPIGTDPDTNTRARVSVNGRLVPVEDPATVRNRYLRRQPAASAYVDFTDFTFMALRPESAHIVAGFGRITDLSPDDLLAGAEDTAAVAAMEEGAARHMDEDHADAMALMANVLAEVPGGPWRAVGIDPLGIDLGGPDRVVRVEFDAPATSAKEVRMALVDLTKRARARLEEGEAAGAA